MYALCMHAHKQLLVGTVSHCGLGKKQDETAQGEPCVLHSIAPKSGDYGECSRETNKQRLAKLAIHV